MMKVAIVNPFKAIGLNKYLHKVLRVPSAKLHYLASLVPSDVEVEIMDEAMGPINYDTSSDVIAISPLTVTAHRAYEMADRFREKGKTVVMGGSHVSALPNEALQHCDAVAVGNGESTFPVMLNDLASGRPLKSIYHNRIPNVLPQRVLGKDPSRLCTTIISSRGCEMNCQFCTMQNLFGHFYLQRDSACVQKEIESITTPYAFFADDNFWGSRESSKKHSTQLLLEMSKRNVKWAAQCRLDAINNDATLNLFKDTGCMGVLVGFETINPKSKMASGKPRADKKRYEEAIKKIHSYGIGVIASFIFGFDDDDQNTIDETLEFCIKNKVEIALFTILTPFPGTLTFSNFEKDGRIISKNWDDYTMDRCVFQPKHFSPSDLEKSVRTAMKDFYSVSSVAKRVQFGMNYSTMSHYFLPNLLRLSAIYF